MKKISNWILILGIVAIVCTFIFLEVKKKHFESKSIQRDDVKCCDFYFEYLELANQCSNIDIVEKENIDNADSYKLVYVFSESDCRKCVMDDILMLKRILPKEEYEYVLVYALFDNTRENIIRLNADLDGFHYKILDNDLAFNVPVLNGKRFRFFSVVNASGQFNLPFFPERCNANCLEKYINGIIEGRWR